jgi:large subunit ribosomal protein L4
MDKKLLSVQGKEVGVVKLDDAIFNQAVNEDAIYYAINNELANARVGTACTKDRGEVHGSNVKPFKQKGTGHARQGDFKSPLYVGGGVVFGPHPRDYSYALPKKVKRLAMKTILSLKAQDGTLAVVEDFTVETGKTRDLVKRIEALASNDKPERTVLILKDDDADVKRAGRNLPWLSFLSFNRLRAHDLFYGRKVLVLESAVKGLNEFYSDK